MASCGFRNSKVALVAAETVPWAFCAAEPCPVVPVFNESKILRLDEAPLWADIKPLRKTKITKNKKCFFM
jgi:hypothetical protein